MDLTAGKIAWTDEGEGCLRPMGQAPAGYITANHAAIDWQDAAALLVQGKAANYVMGNFAVGIFKEGGMTNDNLGFMVFPEITPGIPRAEDAPTDTIHIPAGAKNVEDAKMFLAFVASRRCADQAERRASASCRPTRTRPCRRRPVPRRQASTCCPSAYALAQFFDRDAPAEMAKAGMEGFQEFMVQPGTAGRDPGASRRRSRQQVYK